MILLVDLCYEKDSLSSYEFVYPISETLIRLGLSLEVIHYQDMKCVDLEKYDKAILCGTTLKDNLYATNIELFSWIKNFGEPILGICAGMQVIGSVFGGHIIPQFAIGLEKIEIITESQLLGKPRVIEGYHLHNLGVTLPDNFSVLAGITDKIDAFEHKYKPIYGVLFHPEVRNRWILERFAEL